MPELDELRKYVAYCGFYCRLCPTLAVYPKQARALRDSLQQDGWTEYGPNVFPGFEEFWSVLDKFTHLDDATNICQNACGFPDCEIRQCARERGVVVCGLCPDYPCPLLDQAAEASPAVRRNNDRIREIGLDAWIQEMEGFLLAGKTLRDL